MADQKEVPPVVVEFHYEDGDVGVYPCFPGSHEEALWLEFDIDDGFPQAPAHHIVLRRKDDDGQQLSNRLMASDAALRACDLLVCAYIKGEDAGGSIDWSGVDLAHEVAQEAMIIARDGKAASRGCGDSSTYGQGPLAEGESVSGETPSAERTESPRDDATEIQTFLDDLETAMNVLRPHLGDVVLSSMNEQAIREYGAAYLTRLKNRNTSS